MQGLRTVHYQILGETTCDSRNVFKACVLRNVPYSPAQPAWPGCLKFHENQALDLVGGLGNAWSQPLSQPKIQACPELAPPECDPSGVALKLWVLHIYQKLSLRIISDKSPGQGVSQGRDHSGYYKIALKNACVRWTAANSGMSA